MRKNGKISMFAPALASALIIGVFVAGIMLADKKFDSQRLQSLKDAVIRSAVSCYAIEGFYPPKLAYLEENYGLIVDRKNFTVYYEAYGSNILPEVTVLHKGQVKP